MRNIWWGLTFLMMGYCTNGVASELDLKLIPENSSEMAQVRFWARVFTEWGSDDRIVHNANDLSQIYLVSKNTKMTSKDLVKSIHPAPLNARVQVGQKDRIKNGYQVSKIYLNRISEIFAEEHVPKELTLLSFMESGFDQAAKSKVGATGVWQIMKTSSRGKLKVNSWVDERLDPIKSSRGAAKLLKEYYNVLGSWPLTIMAYHQGVSSVKRAIKKYKTNDPFRLIKLNKNKNFGFASRNYLYEFYAMVDVAKVNSELFKTQDLPPFVTASFSVPISYRTLKIVFKTNETDFKTANPHFLRPVLTSKMLIPAQYPIRLPNITLVEFKSLSNKAGLY